jgi:hypothetical protein
VAAQVYETWCEVEKIVGVEVEEETADIADARPQRLRSAKELFGVVGVGASAGENRIRGFFYCVS